ncbi:hypothetical protein J4231_00485 [Candidatus Woesearchaeota archaeon]|nr:hypothetical protein [Candidatus Woesearchaeota archaeon]
MLYESFKKSWSDFDKRLIVPIILQNLVALLLLIVFLYINGLLSWSFLSGIGIKSQDSAMMLLSLFSSKKFIISGIAFLILAFAFNAMFSAMRLAFTNSLVQRKPMTVDMMFRHGLEDFGRVLAMKLLLIAVVVLAVIAIVLLSLLAKLASESAVIFVIIALGLLAGIVIGLGMLFAYATMFIMNTGAYDALKKSFSYGLHRKGLAIKTVLFLILMALPSLLLNLANGLNESRIALGILISIRLAYGFFLIAWNDLFIFNVYNSNKNPH